MRRREQQESPPTGGAGLVLVGVLVGISLFFAGACTPVRKPGVPLAAAQLVWPAPPRKARIAFVQVIAGPEDLGIGRSVWRRLSDAFRGVPRPRMVRPSAVTAKGGIVAVADPGARGLHLFNRLQPSYRFISGCEGTRWAQPVGVAFLEGKIYLSDSVRRTISVLDESGQCLAEWRIPGKGRPTGLAPDSRTGRLVVADTGAHKVWVFSPEGVPMAEFGRRGDKSGEFNFPGWVAVGKEGELFVVDSLNFRVQVLDLRGGTVGIFGQVGDSAGYFARPKGIGVDSEGHIYVVDALFDTVQIFDREGHLLLNFGERGYGPGQFWLPSGLFVDDRDFIYVADSYNRRIQVFRFLGGE